MEVRGEFAERDYLRAQWLHIKPRRRFRIVGYAVLALFVLALVLVASRVVSEVRSQVPDGILTLLPLDGAEP
jgi:hypothetical protein